MSDAVRQLDEIPGDSLNSPDSPTNGSVVSLTGGMFALFALEWILMGFVVWSYLFLRTSYPDQTFATLDWGWGWLVIAAAVWGTLYLALSRRSGLAGDRGVMYGRWMIVAASGAVLLGGLLLNMADRMAPGAEIVDLRGPIRERYAALHAAEPTEAVAGDPARGKKWFSMSCVTCHGPTGDGVPNAAPSLRTSDFRHKASELEIAALIRNGRPVGDPANKTGKPMPAKGGNPFLDESKIADLVAFLKDLDNQMPAADGGAGESASDGRPVGAPGGSDTQQPPTVVHEWNPGELVNLYIPSDQDSIALGAKAFVKASCSKCHMAAVEGRELAPTLDQITAKYKRHELLLHIVDPSREINEKFQSHRFLLVDGRMLTGVIATETEDEVQLITDLLKPDVLTRIPADEVEEQAQAKVSAMPTGLLNVLTREEIGALVAYVDSAGKQMQLAKAPQLNQWVVPAASAQPVATEIAASGSGPYQPFSLAIGQHRGALYAIPFVGLFLLTTTVLAFHFLWVTGAGTAIVLHRELQLGQDQQVRLASRIFLFWTIGIIWLALWFLLFFLIG